MNESTLYTVAPFDQDQRDRHFLTEGAAVEYAAQQVAAAFHTPEWRVHVRVRECRNALYETVAYLTVVEDGTVVHSYYPA